MDSLTKARETIDRVDAEMARLFEARMAAVREVAAYKKEHGLPLEDKAREKELLRREVLLVSPEIRPYFERFLRSTLQLSKEYQHRTIDGSDAEGN